MTGAVHDERRIDYVDRHITAVRRAIDQGVDVQGYYLWSLTDNFEWAEGYTQRFGLVHIDFETGERTPKDSYAWYRDRIASSRSVDGEQRRPQVGAGVEAREVAAEQPLGERDAAAHGVPVHAERLRRGVELAAVLEPRARRREQRRAVLGVVLGERGERREGDGAGVGAGEEREHALPADLVERDDARAGLAGALERAQRLLVGVARRRRRTTASETPTGTLELAPRARRRGRRRRPRA